MWGLVMSFSNVGNVDVIFEYGYLWSYLSVVIRDSWRSHGESIIACTRSYLVHFSDLFFKDLHRFLCWSCSVSYFWSNMYFLILPLSCFFYLIMCPIHFFSAIRLSPPVLHHTHTLGISFYQIWFRWIALWFTDQNDRYTVKDKEDKGLSTKDTMSWTYRTRRVTLGRDRADERWRKNT